MRGSPSNLASPPANLSPISLRGLLSVAFGVVLFVSVSHAAPEAIRWEAVRTTPPGGRGMAIGADGRVLVCLTHEQDHRQQLQIFESRDGAQTFAALPTPVATDGAGVDLGDACILAARDGSIWISYRHNHDSACHYAIEVGHSLDGGKTWAISTVAISVGQRGEPSRGLWSSFLLERSDGVIQCYFDDEDAPFRGGKPGHQWITMKTWDARQSKWTTPVIASRSHDPKLLSRDGMMSVVELSPNQLLMTFESVATDSPHQNVVRSVSSDDGGATWSWATRERGIVYAAKPPFMALCPWMTSLGGDRLMCVFCTDEDRATADVSGTPVRQLHDDIKYVISDDTGKTWSASLPIGARSHRNYAPSVGVRVTDGKTEILAPYFDFATGKCLLVRGILSVPSPGTPGEG